MAPVTEVRTWVASTAPGQPDSDSDELDGTESELRWDNLQESRGKIITPKISLRVPFLKEELMRLVTSTSTPSPSQKSDLIKLLFQTIPRYDDSSSRNAVLNVLHALIHRSDQHSDEEANMSKFKLLSTVIKWISHESDKLCANPQGVSTGAGSTRLAMLIWSCHLLGMLCLSGKEDDAEQIKDMKALLNTLGQLLNSMYECTTRNAYQKSAVVVTRRIIRNNYEKIPPILDTLTQESSPSTNASLLGLVIDVSLRLRVGKEKQKGSADGVGVSYILSFKDRVLQWWISHVLCSRNVLPPWTTTAFADFFQTALTPTDYSDQVSASAHKMMLRSPEIAMPALSAFLVMSAHKLSTHDRLRFLPAILSASKSTKLETRTAAMSFFETVFKDLPADQVPVIAEEVSLPLKTGKISSPEHRAALLNIVAGLTPGDCSHKLLSICCDLLLKETNEDALTGLTLAIKHHLSFLLSTEEGLDVHSVQAITKAMQDSKPLIRRAICNAIGLALWTSNNEATKLASTSGVKSSVVERLAPPFAKVFEVNLKNASVNPLTSAAGPLEGYVAISLAYTHPLRDVFVIQAMRKSNPAFTTLTAGPPKPNFLYMEKLYRKSTFTMDESMWLGRALDSVFGSVKEQLLKDQLFRVLFAQTTLFLCTESPYHPARQFASMLICNWFRSEPRCVLMFLIDGLKSQLLTLGTSNESENTLKWSRMRHVISNLFKITKDWDEALRAELLCECFVVFHHALFDSTAFLWIDLVHCTGLDPKSIIASNFEALHNMITAVLADASFHGTRLNEGAYRAISSMCLVVPEIAVPVYVTEIMETLDPQAVFYIETFESGVWKTPAGLTFVDVLSSQKNAGSQPKNSKDKSIEAWEQELRASIEQKKAGGTKVLSKVEKALVENQLIKEAETREKVRLSLNNLKHGFRLIHSFIEAREGAAHTLVDYTASLVERILAVMHTDAAELISSDALSAFRALGQLCIARLGSIREPLTMAILRGMNAQGLSTELTAEPLCDLVTRVLYKLRSLAEQQALDATNFSYFTPLLSQVIRSKGIGVTSTNIEDGLEQIALVVDIMVFSGSEACKLHDLRSTIMRNCLAVIGGFPQLIKPATTALISVGLAISPDASDQDIQTLLEGFLSTEAQARYAALQAAQPLDLTDNEWSAELFVACHDDDERNASLASNLWAENGLATHENCLKSLLVLLEHRALPIRNAAAKAIASAVSDHPSLSQEVLQAIPVRYQFLARELVPEYDQFGMIIPESLDREDPWLARAAQADALCAMAPLWSKQDILPLFDFLVVEQALGDRNQAVRTKMLAAGNAAIDLHGADHLEKLIATFEEVLSRGTTGSDAADYVTESAVLLFGRLARHLNATDVRLAVVVERLVDALKTPSEVVQSAVSDCMPPLIRLQRERIPILIQRLLQDTLSGSKYAERRGAAYGLAGAIKGRGITSLKDFSIIDSLRDALEDKKNTRGRQGALFAFEILASSLGRLFEPYLIQATSLLLTAFGDGSADVREAIQDTARVIMKGLSGHAVKLILPALLEGLDDKQWRTKKGAIELMGAMAYLAPKQLSMSLPTIIPRLTEVLTDSHAQVRAAANTSLKKFGEVVSNPEISAMQDVLLAALVDPARKTARALEGLLGTAFVHYIDTSSLALVVPIIERGLRERSADIKRKATQIVGNLATLAEAKDLSPYLPQLMPKVRQVLVDPVPEARATAAKALGSLVERLGEESFPELVPSLFETLCADASGVDQQGAAQGLSEIMSGLGTEKLDDLLPDIIKNTSSPRAYVREGFISLLIFLPATYGDRFSPYLGRIIQPVLNGLADESDYVRDASMRAGRMIITNHSTRAVELLLPELEQGLFNEQWRFRQSSIQLMGDLLFRVSGITAKADIDDTAEDDEAVLPTAETSRVALVDSLGKERRDRVLAAIYIIRQDPSGIVRSTSVHIWKALVQNTPKTVRDIMPVLMQTLIRTLASTGEDQRETAARTLGELVKKLGDNVLSTITNILQKAMLSDDVRTRQGVSLAIIDVISSISQTQLEDHEGSLIAIVRMALVDHDASVRSTAALAFDSLQQRVGSRAVEETLPTLLSALRQSGDASEAALAALKELMRVRAASILPRLLPVLTKAPITAFNARALASLVSVSGSVVNRYLCSIVASIRSSWLIETDEDIRNALDSSLRIIFDSTSEIDALNTLMMHLLELAKSPLPAKRVDGCDTFAIFCSSNTCDLSEYHVLWIRQLVSLFEDPVPQVVDSAWIAMDEMVKTIPKTSLDSLVVPLRRTLEGTGIPGQDLPGLCRPAGLKVFMPILLQGLLAGTAEQREQAALGFGDVIERTSQEYIKPYVTQITGPLIRIVGDRFPAPVKSAILQTSAKLLQRIPQFAKPFFPQLQRTFVKCASDISSGTVRNKAVIALGLLMKHQPRVDPLVTELLGTVKSTEDGEIRESMVSALAAVTTNGGANISDGMMTSLVSFAEECLQTPRHVDSFASAVARLVAAIAQTKSAGIHSLTSYLFADPTTSLAIMCLRDLVDVATDAIRQLGLDEKITFRILAIAAGTQPPNIGRPAREARELLRLQGKLAEE